jgi:hypothetical protein
VRPKQVVSGGRRERALELSRRADADVPLRPRKDSP